MGVSGLLGLLKSIQKPTSLKAYSGQTLGVDAFGWLHRGATGCAYQLALDKPTTFYVTFVVNRVRMLLDFGITPYLVFDGDALPSKAETNNKRREERKLAKEQGLSLLRSGRKEEAYQKLRSSVSITPQMTFHLIEELRRMNVQVLVAPYEADAQLVYLEKEGIIDGIISEDSDLLVFGAKKLITKLDQNAMCTEINRADFVLNKEVSLAGWSDTMFRRMAILSGCDYLDSVGGVGLRTAYTFVKRHKEMGKIIRMMALSGKYTVPSSYLANFEAAERAFLYQRVFCPRAGNLVFLNAVPPDVKEEDMPYLGAYVESEIAVGVACGDLNPKTKEPFQSSRSTLTPKPPQIMRRQTMNTSTDLKPKRSIENFFKPSRTPLAELDPNSLTPSPSQQRVLERNRNATWEPRITNSAPPLRRNLTDAPRSVDAPRTIQIDRSTYLSRASAASNHKPVKRQRLCSESDEFSPSKEIKQSPFFSRGSIDQSPLTNRKTRDQRRRKSAFDVFADDTEEGIFHVLEEQTIQTTTEDVSYPVLPAFPETETFVDDTEIVPQSSPVKANSAVDESQSSHGTAEIAAISFGSEEESQSAKQQEKPKVDDSTAFEDLLSYHVTSLNQSIKAKGLHSTFSYQSPEMQSAALSSLAPSVQKPAGEDNDFEPLVEDITSPQKSTSSRFRSITKTFGWQSSNAQTRALQSLSKGNEISNIKCISGRLPAQGSEDALPLSSDADAEETEEQPKVKIDLNSFRYQA